MSDKAQKGVFPPRFSLLDQGDGFESLKSVLLVSMLPGLAIVVDYKSRAFDLSLDSCPAEPSASDGVLESNGHHIW